MEIFARQRGLVALGFSAECQCPDPHIHTTKIIKRLRINDQNRKSNLVSMSKKKKLQPSSFIISEILFVKLLSPLSRKFA